MKDQNLELKNHILQYGGILGGILGGIGGEKLGKVVGTSVFDAMQKNDTKKAKDSGKVENILQNQSELQRTKDMAVDQKVFESAKGNKAKHVSIFTEFPTLKDLYTYGNTL